MNPASRSFRRWWLTVVSGRPIAVASTRPHSSPRDAANNIESSLILTGWLSSLRRNAMSMAAMSLTGPAATGAQYTGSAVSRGGNSVLHPFHRAPPGPADRRDRPVPNKLDAGYKRMLHTFRRFCKGFPTCMLGGRRGPALRRIPPAPGRLAGPAGSDRIRTCTEARPAPEVGHR